MARRPPELIEAGRLLLRRQRAEDAQAIAVAVAESLEHLRPWMPWATPEAATVEAQRSRLTDGQPSWETDTEYSYVIVSPPDDEVLGCCGLHRRVGPSGIEIGYWTHVNHLGQGIATTAADALTSAALALDGIERVEIHCDQANTRSAAVPRRLGYRLDRIETEPPEAPAEVGESMIWILER